MGMKTSKLMELFIKMKGSGKSVLYADLLRAGFDSAHIELAISTLSQYKEYAVTVENCDNTLYTKIKF